MRHESDGYSYNYIGTLGTTPKQVKKRLEVIGIETRVKELQKTVIIHSSRILRNVFEI